MAFRATVLVFTTALIHPNFEITCIAKRCPNSSNYSLWIALCFRCVRLLSPAVSMLSAFKYPSTLSLFLNKANRILRRWRSNLQQLPNESSFQINFLHLRITIRWSFPDSYRFQRNPSTVFYKHQNPFDSKPNSCVL